MRHFFLILFLLLFAFPVSAAPDAPELLKRATLDLAEVRDIQFKATRLTTKDGASLREQWKMAFRQPADFRLDFLSPRARVIAADEKEMIEFVPRTKQGLRTSYRSPAFEEAKKGILARVSILGSRLGSLPEILERFDFKVLPEGKNYRIEGRSKKKEKMILWLTPEGLERQELYDEQERLAMRQTAKNFLSFGKASLALETRTEVFFPERIDLEIRLRDVRINQGMEGETLRFTPPPGTHIIEKTL
ncbi:MAG TPA: hypothetical protein DD435_04685 [Cyanobacteria bacterium UBA8530]|nr:hypothetical protein [Cyanobacteria bacterium UBA8530]